MKFQLVILTTLAIMMISCTAVRTHGTPPIFAASCSITGPTGEIDAHPILNINDITTFRASEFNGCPGDRNLLVVSWKDEMTVSNVDLARTVAGRFFSHFHPGEPITFAEVDATSHRGASFIVFQFTTATRRAI